MESLGEYAAHGVASWGGGTQRVCALADTLMSPRHATRVMHYVRFRTDPCSVGDYNGCSVAGALSVKGGCGGAISRRWSTATEFPFLPCCKGVSLVDGKEPAMTPDAPVWMKERRNGLLAALPAGDLARIAPYLEEIPMPLGGTVYESGAKQRHVFFPTTGIVSLLYVMANGSSAEIAVVGNEGIVGIALFMGGETTPSRAIVQSAGYAYRLGASVLKDEFQRGGALQHRLLRYTQALITQMSQTAVCNRHRSVDQQLCRWLLLSLDRLPSNQLTMTQELI